MVKSLDSLENPTNSQKKTTVSYSRISLDYSLKALEPYLPREIMNDHYNGNHQAYQTNLNLTLARLKKKQKEYLRENCFSLKELLQNLTKEEFELSSEMQTSINFQAGGLLNHNYFFWHLGKNQNRVSKNFLEALRNDGFNRLDPLSDLKSQLIEQALSPSVAGQVCGSYWTWLVINQEKKLKILKTANQDSPWLFNCQPLIALDMWEHAYLRKYNFDSYGKDYKKEYLKALLEHCLNWPKISQTYLQTTI